jgi:hypothetical protein
MTAQQAAVSAVLDCDCCIVGYCRQAFQGHCAVRPERVWHAVLLGVEPGIRETGLCQPVGGKIFMHFTHKLSQALQDLFGCGVE